MRASFPTSSGMLPIAEICDAGRLRDVDPSWVEALAAAMDAAGQEQPIVVRAAPEDEQREQPYALVIGGHRLAAARLLGWTEIRAEIRDYTALQARLAEVDENLIRHELNALDRALFFAERRRVWDQLHPEASHGGDRKSQKAKANIKLQGLQLDAGRFTEEAAARCGFSPRTVYASLQLAQALAPAAIAAIRGTSLARNGSELQRLAAEPVDRQEVLADMVIKGLAPSVSKAKIKIGMAPTGEDDPQEALYRHLVANWERASKEVRRRFMVHADLVEAVPAKVKRERGAKAAAAEPAGDVPDPRQIDIEDEIAAQEAGGRR